ncbi:MAG TPA: HAMP domain-containing sensor histidine kinase, partial [Flavobacterium sp.]|nr:HAMP domain-containing sensor histidine kinase [Flavobacterium sp.]
QKDFIGNASHELQTPLAIVTNKIELLLENEDLKEEQALNIVEIYQIIQRLIRVNKSLLLLSKIDNKQFFDNQNLSVNTIVHQSISELDEFISFKNIDVEVVENTEEFLQIDAVLANVIIGNLIKNAIFHNVENGKIKIEISNSELIVSNTGKLQALEERELFTRFQKSNSEASGTGLGLAIVKAITELYDYAIAYTFKNQMHCFEIKFTQNNSQKR